MFRAVETFLKDPIRCNCMQLKLGYQIACKCHKETKYLGGEYFSEISTIKPKCVNSLRYIIIFACSLIHVV